MRHKKAETFAVITIYSAYLLNLALLRADNKH